MPPNNPITSTLAADHLMRALGEAVVRIWSNFPHDVQNLLFQEAVRTQGESIRSQLAIFLHGKHSRTSDPLGNPREMKDRIALGVSAAMRRRAAAHRKRLAPQADIHRGR
jgi:hypothetical protein